MPSFSWTSAAGESTGSFYRHLQPTKKMANIIWAEALAHNTNFGLGWEEGKRLRIDFSISISFSFSLLAVSSFYHA